MKIKVWKQEDPVTWRNRETESALGYTRVKEEVEKLTCKIWQNEETDASNHIIVEITKQELGTDAEYRVEGTVEQT